VHYGIEIVTLGPLADPRRVVELAVAAEEAGFEMVAVWDHLAFAWGVPSAEPLVTLSAVAQSTKRVRLLPFVTPLARHRPHVLAWQLACLDVLSEGRLVLGAGLGGVPEEFSAFGEESSPSSRAQKTDEALAVISRLWAGEQLSHTGLHYRVEGVALAPLPVQRPRPPIWIGGDSDGALRRAARWDGWAGAGSTEEGTMAKSVAAVAAVTARLRELGAPLGDGFDVVLSGVSHGPRAAAPSDYAAAGVSWWLESISPSFGDGAELRNRIEAGPPLG
jgi:alkanesulfonate monooxygenase SsuD/methylene tetrahydromethanopterin reductase-like flavin-dependent oxidoreductase (luciferase family)